MLDQFVVDEKQFQEVVTTFDSETPNVKKDPRELQEPVFPIELLSTMLETGFLAIKESLKKHEVPQELLDLVEDVEVLGIEMSRVELGKVPDHVNQNLLDVVSSLSRNIVNVGGIFYSPMGTTIARDVSIGKGTLPSDVG